MTRLTTIGHLPPSQRQAPERQPARDFAEALAKDRGTANQGRQASTKAPTPKQMPAEPAQAAGTAALAPAASAPATKATVPPAHPATVAPAVHGPVHLPIDSLVMPAEHQLLAAKVSPVGLTEALQSARVFGVHLLAGCYLSELSLRELPAGPAPQAAAHVLPGSETSAAMPALDAVATLVSPPEASRSPADPEIAVATDETLADVESRRTADKASSSVAEQSCAATEVAWSERILRITGSREGHMIAWLRDYRLDGGEAEKLVQSVLQEARMHGVKLAKIIVNGREAWASREAI